jgi:DNA end-binding protein Ku
VVAPSESSLTLLTLRFPDELLPLGKEAAPAKVTSTELSMAKQLIQKMSGKFVPSHLKDTYHSDLKHRVQDKIRNKETHALDVEPPAATERPKAEVIDLVAALKASLSKGRAGARSHTTRRRSRARKMA